MESLRQSYLIQQVLSTRNKYNNLKRTVTVSSSKAQSTYSVCVYEISLTRLELLDLHGIGKRLQ